MSSLPALTELNLAYCDMVTNEGIVRAVSSLPKLTFLALCFCRNVTDDGLLAV